MPDPNFVSQNLPFYLINKNTSVGESAPSTVSFSAGTANAALTVVQASSLTSSQRTTYVNANAAGTNSLLYAYWNVIATDEGLVGQTTACGHVIQSNDHFVALPYGSSLCNQGVHLTYGANQQNTTVLDVGPWCPHSAATKGYPCVCGPDDYWLGSGIPFAQTNSCSSNHAGIDLADGTFSGLGLTGNAYIDWKFQP